MSSVAFNYNDWVFWEPYNPPTSYGTQKVVFDGPNKVIIVAEGVTSVDFRLDVYEAWKEWILDPNHVNSLYLEAISVTGGDPLPGNRKLGTTFFLENGWRMRTWEGDHEITLTGNVFTREGDPVFVPTLNPWTITVNLNTSTLVETIETGAILGTNTVTQVDDIHKIHGLDANNNLVVTPTSRTAGAGVQQTITQDGDDVTVSRN